jgi:alpha-methylacyl-CoA racemase
LVEGFRPGVAERMGFGPEACLERNPRLVFGRMTGWGQEGPMASAAGHDINYIALTGALAAIGPKDGPPSIPLNYVGDFGGGGIYLALGVVSAILEASRSGRGQVVDTAMVDGAASLSALFYVLQQIGYWQPRGGNFLDGGAPFYGVYETKDGKYVSIGALEGKFFKELLERLEITDIDPAAQHDPGSATLLRGRFTEVFLTRTRDEWCSVLEGTDACFAPVLEFGEAADHPHMAARGTFTEIEGVRQPVPAPRFDRTPATIGCPPPSAGQDTAKVLSESGFSDAEIRALAEAGVTGDDPNS